MYKYETCAKIAHVSCFVKQKSTAFNRVKFAKLETWQARFRVLQPSCFCALVYTFKTEQLIFRVIKEVTKQAACLTLESRTCYAIEYVCLYMLLFFHGCYALSVKCIADFFYALSDLVV